MKSFRWVCLVVALSPALAGAQEARPDTGSTSGAEQELMRIERQWAEALRSGDAQTLEGILADDMIYTSPDGERQSKAEEVANLSSGRYKVAEFSEEPMQVKVFGDVAVVIGGHTEKSTFDGEDSSGHYRWTETWVKRDGRWQVVAGQINKVPQP